VYLAFSAVILAAYTLLTVAAIAAHAMQQPWVGVFCSLGNVACTSLAMVAAADRPQAMPMFYCGFVISLLSFGMSVAGAVLHLTSVERRELAALAPCPEPPVTDDAIYRSRLPSLVSLGGRRSKRPSETGVGTVRPHRAGRQRRRLRVPVLHINRNEHAHV
jgi:hypothetical protein